MKILQHENLIPPRSIDGRVAEPTAADLTNALNDFYTNQKGANGRTFQVLEDTGLLEPTKQGRFRLGDQFPENPETYELCKELVRQGRLQAKPDGRYSLVRNRASGLGENPPSSQRLRQFSDRVGPPTMRALLTAGEAALRMVEIGVSLPIILLQGDRNLSPAEKKRRREEQLLRRVKANYYRRR